MHHGSVRLTTLLCEPSRGIASLPWASRLVVDGNWLRSALRSSFGEGLAPGRASGEACPAITRALAPNPLPRGGVPTHGPPHVPGVEDDAEDVLRRAWERSTLRREFLQRAADAVDQLGVELAGEDARLEAEGLRLANERRKLRVDVSLTRHQCDLENAKAEASLAASREACSQAVEQAQEADRWCKATEERAWELQAWSNSLERQVELRQVALVSLKRGPEDEAELRR